MLGLKGCQGQPDRNADSWWEQPCVTQDFAVCHSRGEHLTGIKGCPMAKTQDSPLR